MPGTLDLDGATVTLTDDTVYTYYQITDTSASHDGKLIIGDGTILRFDDRAGAGFVAAATLIEIYCNGTVSNNCAIISANPTPSHLWTMPATTTTVDANHCEFSGQTGSTSANNWSFETCIFAGSRYCSVEELIAATGSESQRVPLGVIVEDATRNVNQYILSRGLSTVAGYVQRGACLKLSIAGLFTRYRMDGTKPASLNLGPFSMSDNIDDAIRNLTKEAFGMLDNAGKINRKWQTLIRKANR